MQRSAVACASSLSRSSANKRGRAGHCIFGDPRKAGGRGRTGKERGFSVLSCVLSVPAWHGPGFVVMETSEA